MAHSNLHHSSKISQLVDGMITLLGRTLVAHTRLTDDAIVGNRFLKVENAIRFRAGEQIVIFDDLSQWNDDLGSREGVEFHTVASDATETNTIVLSESIESGFLVSNNARVQKAIEYAVLDAKDIYYGDRESLTFNEVAICVEPESKTSEWMALGGLGGYEYRLGIMVYVTTAGSGESRDENRAARVCHAYADAVEDLLLRNIHIDLTVDEVPILADVCPGQDYVIISKSVAEQWPTDSCGKYEIQDNFNALQRISIINCEPESSSSSSENSCLSCDFSTSSDRSFISSSSSKNSSQSSLSSLSSSASSLNSSSSSSLSSISSESQSSSMSTYCKSSESSTSSLGQIGHIVCISCQSPYHIRVSDKAVLRRKDRYLYDSRVSDTEYGLVAKGSYLLKAAKLSWFGKETRKVTFPQIGLGGNVY